MAPAQDIIDLGGVTPTPPVDKSTPTTNLDPSRPPKEPKRRGTGENSDVGTKPPKNTVEQNTSQEPSVSHDGDQGTSEEVSERTGGTPPGLERVKLQPSDSVSGWAGPHKPGPRSESHSSDIQEDYVDLDEFGNDIETSDLPRQPLQRNLRGTPSNSGHGEGDRPENPSYAAALAAENRQLKRSCHTTGPHNVQSSRFVEGSNRHDPPGAYYDQCSEENRQQGVTGGYSFGSLASSIQAVVMPTPQQKIQQLKDELQKSQSQLAETRAYLDSYARELKRTRSEMRSMGHHVNGLEHERQRLKEATQSYENELAIVRRELQDAKNLASIRGKELVGAQVFLTKADALSISEVIEKVTNLNEEIFQAAALLGEALIHKPHDVSQEEMNCALGIAQGMLGGKMIHILREQSRKEVPEANPLIVQVVLQVFLVTYCSNLVHSWSNDPDHQSYLAAVYSRIRDKEEQAVSGRWRALTRSHTRPTLEGWKEDLLRKLGSVLRVASWMTPGAQQRDAFEQKLEPIFRAVEDLRNALGEKFTSADLEVLVLEGDQVFQPSYMDDAYGDPDRKPPGKNAPQELVIGTTGIGLKRAAMKRSVKGELMYESVLSAKVALESTLLEALQPPPPRNNRKKKLTKPLEKEDLPPPPKQITGTGTHKPSSSASTAAAAHASHQGAAGGPPQPPAAPSKTGQSSVPPQPQPQQSRPGSSPGSSRDSGASAGSGSGSHASSSSQQRRPNRDQQPNLRGPPPESQGGNAGAGAGSQQQGQHKAQNSQTKTENKPKDNKPADDGGIEGALTHIRNEL